jgi:hypothetical protein
VDLELGAFLVRVVWIPGSRTRQASAALTLQFHLNGADRGLGRQMDLDFSGEEVQVGEMGLGPIQMDGGRHDGRGWSH